MRLHLVAFTCFYHVCLIFVHIFVGLLTALAWSFKNFWLSLSWVSEKPSNYPVQSPLLVRVCPADPAFAAALFPFENHIPLPTTRMPRPTTVNATICMWRRDNCEAVETMNFRVVTAGFSFLFNMFKYDIFDEFWECVFVRVQCLSSWSGQHFHITAHRGATDFPG